MLYPRRQTALNKMIKGADISPFGKYRYNLWRIWDSDKPLMVWILLNPSTADAEKDDPTIRRCINFSRQWGFGGMHVVNLFTLRVTNPQELKNSDNPIGDCNNSLLSRYSEWYKVAGWGNGGLLKDRDFQVIKILKHPVHPIYCLGKTELGLPRHPLYVRSDKKLERLDSVDK